MRNVERGLKKQRGWRDGLNTGKAVQLKRKISCNTKMTDSMSVKN